MCPSRVALLFLLVCALSNANTLAAQTFQSLGPEGGDVRSLAADAAHPGTVYLGTTDGDVFGSVDAGANWSRLGQVGNDPTTVVSAMVVDASDARTVFATTWTREADREGGGAFVSHDAGRTWSAAGLAGYALRALAQSGADANVLVAGGLDGVFLSRDRGATWKRITPDGDAELRNVDSLAFDPRDTAVIFAGTFHLPWKTMDAGEHWSPVHEGMIDDSDVLSLAIDAAQPDRIYASACSGIYRSDDAGARWRKIAGIPYSSRRTPALKQDPHDPSKLYAGTTEGFWLSDDAGESWRRTTASDWVIDAIAIVTEREGARGGEAPHTRIILGTEKQGVLVSDDGGAHLRRSNAGFVHQRIVSIAPSRRAATAVAILMGDWDAPAQISDDGGATWKVMGNNAATLGLAEIVATPNGWTAILASGGLARYDRGRNTWARYGTGLRAGEMPMPSRVRELAFTDRAWFAAADAGLYSSSDEGESWNHIAFTDGELPVRSVRVSPDGAKIWLASSRGIVISSDGGKTWTWHDLPLDSGGTLRLVAGDSVLLAFATSGVYVSSDAGLSWTKLEHGLPGAMVADALLTKGRWVISMAGGGIYESQDAGASWSRLAAAVGTGARGELFPFLAPGADGESFLAGSANDGLFRVAAGVPVVQ
jgi:photosystem II stability/assembly factor-like uncharacterized protein